PVRTDPDPTLTLHPSAKTVTRRHPGSRPCRTCRPERSQNLLPVWRANRSFRPEREISLSNGFQLSHSHLRSFHADTICLTLSKFGVGISPTQLRPLF